MEALPVLEEPDFIVERIPRRRLWPALVRGVGSSYRVALSVVGWVWGLLSLLVGLSFLASFPIVQFLSLGYLLESSARVARTGRLSEAFIGVRLAGKVGRVAACCSFWLLPSSFVSSMATSAELIDPDGPQARVWRVVVFVVVIASALHVALACLRGGRLLAFFWPFGNLLWLYRSLRAGRPLYAQSRDATCEFLEKLRLPYYFKLGFQGFVGSLIWLAIPATLLAVGRKAPLLGFLGALLLGVVAMGLPFLQVRLAVEGRFRALFEVKAARERYRRAPWAFGLAFLLVVAAAIPLYLLKIELIPREVAWLPGLFFVAFLAPARVACGWAYGRGGMRARRRHWTGRAIGRLAMIPVAAIYVLIVFLAQYTSWGGAWSLYEQHAFLLPVPFLGY